MIFVPPDDAIAFKPFVQDGAIGGPSMTLCKGCTAIDPAPLTAAGVPKGETHSTTLDDGLKTSSPTRWKFTDATFTLALLPTFGVTIAFGLGYVVGIALPYG